MSSQPLDPGFQFCGCLLRGDQGPILPRTTNEVFGSWLLVDLPKFWVEAQLCWTCLWFLDVPTFLEIRHRKLCIPRDCFAIAAYGKAVKSRAL